MNYGLVQGLIQDLTAWIGGKSLMPWIPYQEDGNWEKYLPKYEWQADGYETCGCTCWGGQNQIEAQYKRLYGIEPNYSERFNCARIGIRCPGTNPHTTYENFRKDGLVYNDEFRNPDTHEEFLDQSYITPSLLAKGQNWLHKHDFRHEWVWDINNRPTNYKDLLREALKTCTIGVSVTAWFLESDRYVDMGRKNNHWCLLYRIDDDGTMWIFDTYDFSKKPLHKDHNITMAKRIFLNRKDRKSLKKHRSILQAILERLMKKPTLLGVCQAYLGVDASPLDEVDDDVACSSTVTRLLQKVYPETPHITGTATLYEWLRNPANGWKQVQEPEPECLIISPTSYGNGTIRGHVGIFMEDGLIASNDSRTGKFLQNFDLDTWIRRYRDIGEFPVLFFKRA